MHAAGASTSLVCSRDEFVRRFGAVFEGGSWVAECAWDAGPFDDTGEIFAAMESAVRTAPRVRRLALIQAHPELGTRRVLAGPSAAEQAAAGLQTLSAEEREELAAINAAYRDRFGFPFVVCAREHTRATVLEAARGRLAGDPAEEEKASLEEVIKIARLRFAEAAR